MEEKFIKKKKIVFFLNDLAVGGVQKSILTLLTYLSNQQNYEIDLIVWAKGGILEDELPLNINLIYQSYPATLNDIKKEPSVSVKTKLLLQYFRFKWFSMIVDKPWCYFKSIQNRYDIAVSYIHRGYPLFYTIDKVKAGKKILWFHHGIYEATEKQNALDKVYFNQYDNIIAVSESNKMEISNSFPELDNKLQIISNLVDVEEIKCKSEDNISDFDKFNNEYVFVTVSRVSQEKGIDLALDVAVKLKEKGVLFKWYFVGDGPLLFAMKEKVLELNINDICIFLGAKSNPYPYIKQADLYIQTSYVEAHPITINEALVLKKIIVATNLRSISTELQHGKLGILCEPKSDVFAETIVQLIHDDTCKMKLNDDLEKHQVSNQANYQKINNLF